MRVGEMLLKFGGKVIESKIGFDPTEKPKKSDVEYLFDRYDALEQLKNELIDLVNGVIEKAPGGMVDRVVVFVDDLDRVKPELAVEILEVIKIFLDIDHMVFVLACDYEVVAQGLKAKAGPGAEGISGRSFFDKIIQVPFQMPAHNPDRLSNYIRNLFGRVGAEFSEEEIKEVLSILQLTTGTNPRTIKRLVNILNLLLIVLDNKNLTFDDDVANRSLIVFSLVAFQNAYSEIYSVFARKDTKQILENFDAEDLREDQRVANFFKEKKDDEIEKLVERLNGVIEILKNQVKKGAESKRAKTRQTVNESELLTEFVHVSDVVRVQDSETITEISTGKFVESYINRSSKWQQNVARKILKDLSDISSDPKRCQDKYIEIRSNKDKNYRVAFMFDKETPNEVKILFGKFKTIDVAKPFMSYDMFTKTNAQITKGTFANSLKQSGYFLQTVMAESDAENMITDVINLCRWYLEYTPENNE